MRLVFLSQRHKVIICFNALFCLFFISHGGAENTEPCVRKKSPILSKMIKFFQKTLHKNTTYCSGNKFFNHRWTQINTDFLKTSRLNPCLSVSFICVYLWFLISGFFCQSNNMLHTGFNTTIGGPVCSDRLILKTDTGSRRSRTVPDVRNGSAQSPPCS